MILLNSMSLETNVLHSLVVEGRIEVADDEVGIVVVDVNIGKSLSVVSSLLVVYAIVVLVWSILVILDLKMGIGKL